jgi:hypothetical protein
MAFARGFVARSLAQGFRGRSAARAGYLDLCLPLFAQPRKAVADTGFARISGQYCGQMFDVQVVPDSLSLRKLPCLWLLVTLAERLPLAGTFDVMLRATGTETFSKFGDLPDQIAAPAGFPEGCTIRTDAKTMPSAAVIGRYMAGLDTARLKELVVAEAGVRVVWLAEEADRGRYLLFRDAEMGAQALQPSVMQPLMDGLCGLWRDVMAEAGPRTWVTG